jgi:hypothetical protein
MIAAVRRGRRDANRETPRANGTESGLQAHPPDFLVKSFSFNGYQLGFSIFGRWL